MLLHPLRGPKVYSAALADWPKDELPFCRDNPMLGKNCEAVAAVHVGKTSGIDHIGANLRQSQDHPPHPTLFEVQQTEELLHWQEEWARLGLPLELPNDLWIMFAAALRQATQRWGERSDPELYILQVWFQELRELQHSTGCNEELAQWLLIEWLQRDLPDVTALWDDPDDIVEVEKEAYEAITFSPVYELLARKDKILRSALCKPERVLLILLLVHVGKEDVDVRIGLLLGFLDNSSLCLTGSECPSKHPESPPSRPRSAVSPSSYVPSLLV